MKKLLFILIPIICFISFTAQSQSCLPEGIEFTTQEEIDNFLVNFPDCTFIEGEVRINSGNNPITNLNGLSNIITMGSLIFERPYSLTSLQGLDQLTSISDYLLFIDCDALINLHGLEDLSSVGGRLEIDICEMLNNLDGLNNLTYVGDVLIIDNNPSLTRIDGLSALNYIGGGVVLSDNDALTSLQGFGIQYIGILLNIVGNNALHDLTGLETLHTIEGGYLSISNNDGLVSLNGIQNIINGSLDHININNNPILSICNVKSICDVLSSPNALVEISNNSIGCNNQEEVEEACGIDGVIENKFLSNLIVHPNPCTTSTNIEYELKEHGVVSLKIFNQIGQLVYFQQEIQTKGKQSLILNTMDYPDGIYFFRLQADNKIVTGKMVKR